MKYHSAYQINADRLVARFGYPPLVKGETLEDFKRELLPFIQVFGGRDGPQWHDVWERLIAMRRLRRYTRMKEVLCPTSYGLDRPFGSTWTSYQDQPEFGGEQTEDDVVDAVTRAHSMGVDVTLALDCLIAQARSDARRLKRSLSEHYEAYQANIIDVEYEIIG
jgi:hypothetical protein